MLFCLVTILLSHIIRWSQPCHLTELILYFDLLQSFNIRNGQLYITIKRDNREEYTYHLPTISFTKYLCSLGEIMSMWIAISLFGKEKEF